MIFETFFVSLAFNWSISLSNHETQIHFLWLPFSQICIMANLHEAMSFPQLFAVGIFRGYLPWLSAVGICRGYLPWEFAVAICRGNLPWVFFVYVSKPFFYVSKSFFFVSKPFLYGSKTFFLFMRVFLLTVHLFAIAMAVMGHRTFAFLKKTSYIFSGLVFFRLNL